MRRTHTSKPNTARDKLLSSFSVMIKKTPTNDSVYSSPKAKKALQKNVSWERLW